MNNRCGQVVIVAMKLSGDCSMVEMAKSGTVCCVLRYGVKYTEMTCWSLSILLYWIYEAWCSVVYGGVLVFGQGVWE